MTLTHSNSTPAIVNAGSRLKAAFDKHEAKIRAVPPTTFIPVTFDVTLAYTTSLGKLAKLGSIRAEVEALTSIDQRLISELDERLLALGYALALYYGQTLTPSQLNELVERVQKARQLLASDAAALAKRGLYPSERLVDLKGPITRAEMGFDVMSINANLRKYWDNIQGKTAVTREELDAYDADADQMLVAIGAKNSEEFAKVTELRDAALTHFAEAWNQLRKGVSHVRWDEGDVDELTPTVFTNRVQRPAAKKADASEGDVPVKPAPAAPIADKAVDDDDGPFST